MTIKNRYQDTRSFVCDSKIHKQVIRIRSMPQTMRTNEPKSIMYASTLRAELLDGSFYCSAFVAISRTLVNLGSDYLRREDDFLFEYPGFLRIISLSYK